MMFCPVFLYQKHTNTIKHCFGALGFCFLHRGIARLDPKGRLLTYNQLTNIFPMELAALLVDEGHCDPPLDPLQQT